MMCIALWGTGWEGRRSVEMLAYHQERKRVDILFILHLGNLQKNNILRILHPGNVSGELIRRPWPLPRHINEPKNRQPILESVYHDVFCFDDKEKSLYQANGITAWDSYFTNGGKESVTAWPSRDSDPAKGRMTKVFPENHNQRFAPFSEFELGPFTKIGPILIAFKIWFKGESYDRLLGEAPVFTVDGPESLIIRIKREYILPLPEEDRNKWQERMSTFEHFIGFGESYDVIVLNNPFATTTTPVWKNGIVEAPIQPSEDVAKRYITAYPRFVLALKYVASPRTNMIRKYSRIPGEVAAKNQSTMK
ncbi:MAG: hypothetical protein A2167_00630 [Planctomycetes bacterium RBG_13_46_10]|nr:MAG: hypothetical protein A2167_00630 [Planctomycetes bacterium RBG_13_46_10]